jgi:hypothetical protein
VHRYGEPPRRSPRGARRVVACARARWAGPVYRPDHRDGASRQRRDRAPRVYRLLPLRPERRGRASSEGRRLSSARVEDASENMAELAARWLATGARREDALLL